MSKDCEKWKDQLLEAALQGEAAKDLQEHLQSCGECAAELKNLEARRAQVDALLPLMAQGAQPSAGFRARVLAATEADGRRRGLSRWHGWALGGAMATAAAILALGVMWQRRSERGLQAAKELAAAQKLTEWRAPSDTFLATPGQELLRTTPKLGEAYLRVPASKVEEE